MSAQLNAELDNALQCLLETYNMALEFGDEESKDPNTFLSCAVKLFTIKENDKRMNQAMELAKQQVTTEDFERELENQLKALRSKKFDAKNTNDFKNFKQLLMQISENQVADEASGSNATRVESDDFVMESEINVFDPLTKQRMQNPVRNTLCNHHYEKSTILEAIHLNKRLRCPVAGCGNKTVVTKQHLVDDYTFKVRLERVQNEESD